MAELHACSYYVAFATVITINSLSYCSIEIKCLTSWYQNNANDLSEQSLRYFVHST